MMYPMYHILYEEEKLKSFIITFPISLYREPVLKGAYLIIILLKYYVNIKTIIIKYKPLNVNILYINLRDTCADLEVQQNWQWSFKIIAFFPFIRELF